MSFFKNLFGGSGAGNTNSATNDKNKKSFLDKDNVGTIHDSESKAIAYWMGERLRMARKDPFLLYDFNNENDAKEALLELPCIHEAADSKKLICTELLTYGYYKTGNYYEAIICGDKLTIELWDKAKASFINHGGKCKNEQESTKHADVSSAKKVEGKVTFVKEQRNGSATYLVYKGPNEESAMEFLKQNPVTKQELYLVVETPDGNFCRDRMGFFKEDT